MLVMFTTLIVEKIPFSVFNISLYLYLFLTVSGSFSIKLGFVADHVGIVLLIAIGAIVLLILLARVFWERMAKLREQLISGGAILRTPRRAFTRLVLPELGSYAARLAIVALGRGLGQDRHRLLDRPAADHLRLGQEQRDESRPQGPQAA
jgi:hypothetical protein